MSAELFRRPEPAVSASDITEDAWSPLLSITEDAWSPLLSISITEDAQLLKEIDQFFYDQQLGIDDDSNRYRRMSPSDRFLPAVGKKRKQLQPLFARDTALFSPTAKDNNDASPRSTAAAATAGSSQYIHYDPRTTSSTSKMLLGSHCPRRCVQLARSLHPSGGRGGGGGGGVSVVNSAFLDRRDVWSCRQHSSSSDTALAALMGGRDHRRDYDDDDDDDDDDCALDAADEWGVESMQELARLYQQVGAAGEENNFVDLLGRGGGGGGGCDRSDEEEEDDTISRAIADTMLTRIILRYL